MASGMENLMRVAACITMLECGVNDQQAVQELPEQPKIITSGKAILENLNDKREAFNTSCLHVLATGKNNGDIPGDFIATKVDGTIEECSCYAPDLLANRRNDGKQGMCFYRETRPDGSPGKDLTAVVSWNRGNLLKPNEIFACLQTTSSSDDSQPLVGVWCDTVARTCEAFLDTRQQIHSCDDESPTHLAMQKENDNNPLFQPSGSEFGPVSFEEGSAVIDALYEDTIFVQDG